ncbi:MAG: hypothetical protein ACOC0T_03970, partial [Desulfovermiculus sp.]
RGTEQALIALKRAKEKQKPLPYGMHFLLEQNDGFFMHMPSKIFADRVGIMPDFELKSNRLFSRLRPWIANAGEETFYSDSSLGFHVSS